MLSKGTPKLTYPLIFKYNLFFKTEIACSGEGGLQVDNVVKTKQNQKTV